MRVRIKVEVYGAKVTLVTSNAELMKVSPDATPDMQFITLERGDEYFVCVSDLWDSFHDHRFIQCLSHETNHVAMCILSKAGVNFNYENQGALCYLQDFLVGSAFKALNNHEKSC